MAKLYFKYGAMGAGKSLELLKTAHNYERKGKKVLLLIPAGSSRDDDDVISSRVGLKREAIPIFDREDPRYIPPDHIVFEHWPDIVLVDEAQFLSWENVDSLSIVVDRYDIPVICFGLRTDFRGNLFEGSAALLAIADSIEELRAVCQYCGKKATMNLRLENGKPTKDGSQKQIGDEQYISVCRKHYRKSFQWEGFSL